MTGDQRESGDRLREAAGGQTGDWPLADVCSSAASSNTVVYLFAVIKAMNHVTRRDTISWF